MALKLAWLLVTLELLLKCQELFVSKDFHPNTSKKKYFNFIQKQEKRENFVSELHFLRKNYLVVP